MPTFNSQQLINELQQQTEAILQEAIGQWQILPSSVMLYKQRADTWSATQCLMHLTSYGNYYLPAIQKSIEKAEEKNLATETDFTASFLGNWFTNLMLPKGEKKSIRKMKAPQNHTPVSNDNSDAVLANFINQQEILLQLLERARQVNLRKTKTPISISRWIQLPLGDTFRFLIAHNQRHVLQAERSIASAPEKMPVL